MRDPHQGPPPTPAEMAAIWKELERPGERPDLLWAPEAGIVKIDSGIAQKYLCDLFWGS